MRFHKYAALLLVSFANMFAGQTVKIATYNIYFLDDGISAERKANLESVLTSLNADVIAFEEINNEAALKNILPNSYSIALIDDPADVQEVALAVRAPLKIKSKKFAFPEAEFEEAFPRNRNLLVVEVEAGNQTLYFLVHHAKSRRGGRETTDERRELASELIVQYIKENLGGKQVIVLGDFNDNPDDRSLNILEYGDPITPGGIDAGSDVFLYNTSEQFLDVDYCTHGYSYLVKDYSKPEFGLTVLGSSRENNKWRGITHDYVKDVKVKTILFDQILLSLNLKDSFKKAGIFNGVAAVRGESSRIKFENDKLIYTKRGSLASDHVPAWIELELNN